MIDRHDMPDYPQKTFQRQQMHGAALGFIEQRQAWTQDGYGIGRATYPHRHSGDVQRQNKTPENMWHADSIGQIGCTVVSCVANQSVERKAPRFWRQVSGGFIPPHSHMEAFVMSGQPDRFAVLSPKEMGSVDHIASRTIPVATLMENAGRAVAWAVKYFTKPCRVLVLCGPGNNGGDGYVTARYLAEMGWPVAVAALVEPREGSDAAAVAGRFHGPRVPFSPEEAARVGSSSSSGRGLCLRRKAPFRMPGNHGC